MLDAPAFTPILSPVDRAFQISIQTRHNYYDCLYVAHYFLCSPALIFAA